MNKTEHDMTAQVRARITAARQRAGLTQSELGERCETTGQTIWRLEKGTMGLTVDWVGRIADALGVQPLELLASTGNEDDADPLESALIGAFRLLPSEARREVVSLTRFLGLGAERDRLLEALSELSPANRVRLLRLGAALNGDGDR